ncbi:diguanylate cyclase domain-containing protein [Salinisphaera sp. SWV1]|uniref:diguanylate cyclase domain-containing protein n=1 Tax=Salinisphaera sp. SWV1 TaxID=3454139 RepID=UPI003F869776
MSQPIRKTRIPPDKLLQIINIQTHISQLWLNLGAIMDVAAQGACELTGADGAVIELTEGDKMVYRAAVGQAESQIGLRLNRQGSLSGLCVDTHQILLCDDTESDPRVNSEACLQVGIRSMVTAALRHDGVAVGVLKVLSPKPNGFDNTDIEILDLVTDLLSSFIFHAAEHETGRLFYLATHDQMTGLANRALFFDRFRQRLTQAQRNSDHFGVLYLDMDRLKPINDLYGHRAGDEAITEMGRRLLAVTRESDTVARLGGDEFAILMLKLKQTADVQHLIRRIQGELAKPFAFEPHTLKLDSSIGWAIYPQDGDEMGKLLESADRVMYREKQRKKHPIH